MNQPKLLKSDEETDQNQTPETKPPIIRFTPRAWAKMQTASEMNALECGFFGITTPDNNFDVLDLYLPVQTVTSGSVRFDDSDVARYFGEYCAAGFIPRQLSRVWIHRHPFGGTGLTPSAKDEETFNQLIGEQEIAVMVIFDKEVARAWIQYGKRAGMTCPLRLETSAKVFYTESFEAFNAEEFKTEFLEKVAFETHRHSQIGYFNEIGKYSQPAQKVESILLPAHAEAVKDESSDFCDTCEAFLTKQEKIVERVCQTCKTPLKRCGLCYHYQKTCTQCAAETINAERTGFYEF